MPGLGYGEGEAVGEEEREGEEVGREGREKGGGSVTNMGTSKVTSKGMGMVMRHGRNR